MTTTVEDQAHRLRVLLAERLGSENVVTVEVDPGLAKLAEERLRTCGYAPTVVAGDGRAGHPGGAPYDRLIATCGFTSVPGAWLEQVRPGGLIVCPVGWCTARLVVAEDGTAEGSFLPCGSYFMTVRDAGSTGTAQHPGRPDSAQQRPAIHDLAAIAGDEAFRFLISLAAPNISFSAEHLLQHRAGRCRSVHRRRTVGRRPLLGAGRGRHRPPGRPAPSVGCGRAGARRVSGAQPTGA